jgi:hypothetical protein
MHSAAYCLWVYTSKLLLLLLLLLLHVRRCVAHAAAQARLAATIVENMQCPCSVHGSAQLSAQPLLSRQRVRHSYLIFEVSVASRPLMTGADRRQAHAHCTTPCLRMRAQRMLKVCRAATSSSVAAAANRATCHGSKLLSRALVRCLHGCRLQSTQQSQPGSCCGFRAVVRRGQASNRQGRVPMDNYARQQ